MTLRELMAKVQHLPPDTLVCTAEMEEAFGMNVAQAEVTDNVRVEARKADGTEAIEFGNGNDSVIDIRW